MRGRASAVRGGLLVVTLFAAVACDDDSPASGPGRPNYPIAPICQFKTPCPRPVVEAGVRTPVDAGLR
jgi:hypothetical protein